MQFLRLQVGHFESQSQKNYTSVSALEDEEKISHPRQAGNFVFVLSMCIREALATVHFGRFV